jgi:kinesin family protein 6/9
MKSNIEIYLRLKPLIDNNNDNTKNSKSKMIKYEIEENNNKNKIYLQIPNEYNHQGYINNFKKSYEFTFKGIFHPNSSQEEIFNKIGENIINNSLEGYNSTLFCYGQTGSGKTYTICGKNNSKTNRITPDSGIIPRLLCSFFNKIKEKEIKNNNISYSIYISYIEIYNENAYDLFDKSHLNSPLENWKKIIVYEDNYGNIVMKNMSMIKVEKEEQALDLLEIGNSIRHSSSTLMNLASSRSHAIFSIIIEGKNNLTDTLTISKINLVDLAGSERFKVGNKNEAIFNENKYINLSLSFLEQVIVSLGEKDKGKISHIPYRNSLMTTILKDSLGGNCKTILIANISSDIKYIDETLSTMRFALRCAKVKNEISKNEHIDLSVLINQLQTENLLLKKALNENNKKIEYSDKKLSEFEKDECKIIISDYLNEKGMIKN